MADPRGLEVWRALQADLVAEHAMSNAEHPIFIRIVADTSTFEGNLTGSVRAAAQWQSAWAGVTKTVDGK